MSGHKVSIRFNTAAGESPLKWRVVINGVEHLASQVDTLVATTTTQDFIEGVGEKWHVTCQPDLITWDGDRVILQDKVKKVSRVRHILKSLTYRVYSSCITSLIAAFVTGNLALGFSIGTADFFIKIFTYYLHERVWYHIPFGTRKIKIK